MLKEDLSRNILLAYVSVHEGSWLAVILLFMQTNVYRMLLDLLQFLNPKKNFICSKIQMNKLPLVPYLKFLIYPMKYVH